MIITKESLVDLQEKYEKVKKLIEEDARFDPEAQPYFSKYQARQNLLGMKNLLKTLLGMAQDEDENKLRLIGMHGTVELQLGIIAFDTEELSIAEKHFKECEKVIEGNEQDKYVASVALNVYNQLGIIYAKREQQAGLTILTKAVDFYNKIKNENIIPFDYNDLFNQNYEFNEEIAMEKFEKTFTLTLYYLAQVYGPTDPLTSAVYCHRTLRRQLESDDYDQIDWALNTATLSQFFMEKNGFKQARHHLSASLYMLERHKEDLDAVDLNERGEHYEAKLETYRHRYADVARCWGKYGLILLINSRDRLLANSDIDLCASLCTDISQIKIGEESPLKQEDLDHFQFPTLDLARYEQQITDNFILTIEDAKKVFLNVQKWLLEAQEYYSLNTLASDYIEITQDHSRVYDAVVFFEEKPENRTKLLKRAIDLLENVVKEINPNFYMSYCRQCWFRIGMFYSDILDIKLDKLKESNNRPNPHALNKINSLVDKSIKNFQAFIDSYRNNNGELPLRLQADPEAEKAFLQAYFHIGALSTRHITLDKSVQLTNTEKSLEAYKAFVDYCKRNSETDNLVIAEMSVAREMVGLLPLKIARLRNELPSPPS